MNAPPIADALARALAAMAEELERIPGIDSDLAPVLAAAAGVFAAADGKAGEAPPLVTADGFAVDVADAVAAFRRALDEREGRFASSLESPGRCACGWRRPMIALTTEGGERPPPGVVPSYVCPCCRKPHVAAELPESVAARILDELARIFGGGRS